MFQQLHRVPHNYSYQTSNKPSGLVTACHSLSCGGWSSIAQHQQSPRPASLAWGVLRALNPFNNMTPFWDSETEALREELLQLDVKQLLNLAQQEGVRTAGRSPNEIIEAMLRLETEDDAGTVLQHAALCSAVHQLSNS